MMAVSNNKSASIPPLKLNVAKIRQPTNSLLIRFLSKDRIASSRPSVLNCASFGKDVEAAAPGLSLLTVTVMARGN
jgi:hypothetical protein